MLQAVKNKILLFVSILFLIGCSQVKYVEKEVKIPVYQPAVTDTVFLRDTITVDTVWYGNIVDTLLKGDVTVNPKKKTANIRIKERIDTVRVAITDTVYQEKTNVIQVISGLLPLWAEIVLIAVGILLLAITNKSSIINLKKTN